VTGVARGPLPIDPLLADAVAALRDGPALVIEAPPGAGKTTRVPAALLDGGLAERGEILVLQPRRLPARLAADRVAFERDERTGETVGYTVRFEDVAGPRTRLRFVTEGILVRRLLGDPQLAGVAAVVLDEFHERHLATDLSLALLRALQRGPRPDLRLVVMSATLEADPVREYLGGCPLLRSEGRAFPVDIQHLGEGDAPLDRAGGGGRGPMLADQVAAAVRRVIQESDGGAGDVLVFLPGAAEIRRAAEALAPLATARGLLVLPLHGDLSPAEQNRAVRPADRPKVILSTNVAETSVTIDGVVAVIDSGLARLASHSPWTGLPTLTVEKISQASAIQRAGRAGRTRPGRAVRLYSRHDFESRRGFETPEIGRLDLAEALLTVHALGGRDPERFAWFDPPPMAALAAGGELLRRLAAVDRGGGLTEIGRRMLRFAVHPRLARLIVEGEARGVGGPAAALAALVAEGDIAEGTGASFAGGRGGGGGRRGMEGEGADLLERLDRFQQARAARFARDRLRALAVDGRAAEAAERTRRQLQGGVRDAAPAPGGADAVDQALAISTLAAFPDRVMRRRAHGGSEALLAGGGTAQVGPLPPEDLLVAVDIEERATAGAGRAVAGARAVTVRLAVGIQAEWLLDLFPGDLTESDELTWNAGTERVERVSRLAYGQVILDESRRPADPSPEASRLLVDAAVAAGWGGVRGTADTEGSFAALAAKLEVLRAALPEAGVPPVDEDAARQALVAACEGLVGLAELRATDLRASWVASLPAGVPALLRTETPDRVRLPGGREVVVHYQAGQPPWIESRLQDFFGAAAGPAICRGRVPLTLHLLAPSGRAVQVTRDLAGFWRQHYPGIRRELMRRYPRHPWPEDGATATPPAPRPPLAPRRRMP
jgi:ATP-dependent helicase HrpB